MLIEVHDLKKQFGDTEVLRGINLSVSEGEVACLVGTSGSGKSTLLRCINLLEIPSAGKILFDGTDITKEVKRAHKVRRHVGMVFQHFNLFPHMSALQNVMEGPVTVLKMKKQAARELAMHQLERVGLAEKANMRPNNLSGGQQQRVAIARALAMKPRLMLFDEPTSALDPELVGEVLNTMKALADDGMTMIVVTHEMSFAARVAHRVVMLDEGTIIEDRPPQEFLYSPRTDRAKSFLSQLEWVVRNASQAAGGETDRTNTA